MSVFDYFVGLALTRSMGEFQNGCYKKTKHAKTKYVRVRRSHRRCSVRKVVLRNFGKFTGKLLRPATLLKKRLRHRCFPVNFPKFLRPPFLTEHLWWLLLSVVFFYLIQIRIIWKKFILYIVKVFSGDSVLIWKG